MNTKEQELFKLLVSSYLYGKPIQRKVSEKTFAVLINKGYTTPEAIENAGYDNLVQAMHEGGYNRIDEVTSRRLIELSRKLRQDYGTMTSLISKPNLEQELQTFKGIGPVTSQIFMQRLKDVQK